MSDSMEFSGPDAGVGMPFSGELPDPGIEPGLTHCRQFFTEDTPESMQSG